MAGTLSHLAEPSNVLRKKEHLAAYWIYLCVDYLFRIYFWHRPCIEIIPFYTNANKSEFMVIRHSRLHNNLDELNEIEVNQEKNGGLPKPNILVSK